MVTINKKHGVPSDTHHTLPPSHSNIYANSTIYESLRQVHQYFTLPHIIHMDSTGLHWTPLDSTGLHYILDHYNNIHESGLHWTGLDWTANWTGLDWTGLSAVSNTKLDSTGLDWTLPLYPAQNWTPLDSTGLSAAFYTKLDSTGLDWTPLLYSTQNWTPLDSTGLPATFNTLGSLIIQSPPPLPLLQLQDLQLHLICIPHQHLYYHPPPVKPPHVISNISPNTKLDSTKLYAILLALLNTFLMICHQLLLLKRYSI